MPLLEFVFFPIISFSSLVNIVTPPPPLHCLYLHLSLFFLCAFPAAVPVGKLSTGGITP